MNRTRLHALGLRTGALPARPARRTLSVAALMAIAVAACTLLLGALVVRVVLGLLKEPTGADAAVLALDTVLVGAGLAGLMALVAVHLRDAVMRPIQAVSRRVERMAEDPVLEERVPEQGHPDAVRLAAAVNRLAAARTAQERRLLHEAAVQATGAVLAGVAHELRNPLAVLRLQTEAAGSSRAKDRGLGAVARLEEVVQILEEVAGLGDGGSCDVNRVVRGSLIAAHGPMVLHTVVETDLQATRRVACPGPPLANALVAVVRNAVEAMPEGGTLRVVTRDEADAVVVEVEDSGPGVPESLRASVFEPFTTTRRGHAGLGLPLCRRIVEEAGGSVHLQSREEGGTCVRVRLPAA